MFKGISLYLFIDEYWFVMCYRKKIVKYLLMIFTTFMSRNKGFERARQPSLIRDIF